MESPVEDDQDALVATAADNCGDRVSSVFGGGLTTKGADHE